MLTGISSTQNNKPAFGRFQKITGAAEDIEHFRKKLLEKNGDFMTLGVKKSKKKTHLYILSKKDFDKFIDLMDKVFFFELRTNIEKFMGKKPGTMSVDKAKRQLKHNKFKI